LILYLMLFSKQPISSLADTYDKGYFYLYDRPGKLVTPVNGVTFRAIAEFLSDYGKLVLKPVGTEPVSDRPTNFENWHRFIFGLSTTRGNLNLKVMTQEGVKTGSYSMIKLDLQHYVRIFEHPAKSQPKYEQYIGDTIFDSELVRNYPNIDFLILTKDKRVYFIQVTTIYEISVKLKDFKEKVFENNELKENNEKKEKTKYLQDTIDSIFGEKNHKIEIIIQNKTSERVIVRNPQGKEMNNVFFVFSLYKTEEELKKFLENKEDKWYSSNNVLFCGIEQLKEIGVIFGKGI